jgi:hypothetical protein
MMNSSAPTARKMFDFDVSMAAVIISLAGESPYNQ